MFWISRANIQSSEKCVRTSDFIMRGKSLTSQKKSKMMAGIRFVTCQSCPQLIITTALHFEFKDVLQVWNVMDTLYITAGKNGNEHKPLSHCSNCFTNSYIATADNAWVHYFITVWNIGKKVWQCPLQKFWHFSCKFCICTNFE